MKNMTEHIRRLLALVLALALLLSLSAAAAEDAAETAADPLTADPATVLATVNGQEITLAEVKEVYQQIVDYYGTYGYDMTDPENAQIAREMAMSAVIEKTLTAQKAHELGVDGISPEDEAQLTADNDALWEQAIASYLEGQDGDAVEGDPAAARLDAIAYFNAQGYTVESTLEASREALIQERVVATLVDAGSITDEAVRTAYDDMVAEDQAQYEGNVLQYEYATAYLGQVSLYRPEGYRRVYSILLKADETILGNYIDLAARWEEQAEAQESDGEDAEAQPAEPVTWEQVEEARKAVIASLQDRIDTVYAALDAGTPFLEVADQYSEDTDMKEEPFRSMGYDVHQESVIHDPSFILAAFSMEKPGDVSEPAVTSQGVEILCYVKDLPSVEEPTEADLAEMRAYLVETAEEEAYTAAVNDWFEAAEITYTEAGLAWQPTADEADNAEEAE